MQDLFPIPSCFFASGGDKPTSSDDPSTAASITKLGQSVVLTAYRTLIAGHPRLITVTWCKNLLALGLYVSIETPETTADVESSSNNNTYSSTCKVEMRPWHFWRRHGTKRFNLHNPVVDVFWDLKNAKFSDEPEPVSDYYVAVVTDGEVILLLGDQKHDAFRRTASRPSMFDPVLVSKKEHVFGKKKFVTRAKLDETAKKKTHEICVECSSCSANGGSGDCEMVIRIDGSEGVRVKHLQWKFRGRDCVAVDERLKVEVYWDVHDWLFSSNGLRHALFIFKPIGGGADVSSLTSSSSSSSSSSDFCLFLYAWKIE